MRSALSSFVIKMLFFEKKTELITLLPERLREVEEFKLICGCVAEELDKANCFIAETATDIFVPTAGENGLSRWEKILGVFTPLGTTVKARREAVLAKLMTKPPINLAVLKGIIEAYMGVAVEITVEGYRISVKYRGEARVVDIAPLFVTPLPASSRWSFCLQGRKTEHAQQKNVFQTKTAYSQEYAVFSFFFHQVAFFFERSEHALLHLDARAAEPVEMDAVRQIAERLGTGRLQLEQEGICVEAGGNIKRGTNLAVNRVLDDDID